MNKLLAVISLSLGLISAASAQDPDLLRRAEAGDAEAQFELGRMYDDYRRGLERNESEAAKWFRLSAEQGFAEAQFELGMMYEYGDGVVQNYEEAFKWYLHAAEKGVPGAQSSLGEMYAEGKGVSQDQEEARKWFRSAAEQGHAFTFWATGLIGRNLRQESVELNLQEAINWLRFAAELDAEAQYNLGRLYKDATGVAQNDREAFRWFRLAAEQGHARAQGSLGGMYLLGEGVAQNDQRAYMWFSVAAAQGDFSGRMLRDSVREYNLTTQALQQAQQMATRCFESNFKDCE